MKGMSRNDSKDKSIRIERILCPTSHLINGEFDKFQSTALLQSGFVKSNVKPVDGLSIRDCCKEVFKTQYKYLDNIRGLLVYNVITTSPSFAG
jgi:hypothetical protein